MFLCLVSLLFILMEASMLILGDGDLVVYLYIPELFAYL